MANITLMGASYTDVPAVTLPKTGGGTVTFYENGGAPSATAHTIVFELETGPDVTITAYYDSTWISDAIRATTPTTYNGVTVESASLDGTVWYTRPMVIWETYLDSTRYFSDDGEGGSYSWISELSQYDMVFGDTYRITLDGTVYELSCTYYTNEWGQQVCIGDNTYTEYPFFIIYYPNDAWLFGLNTVPATHTIKIEHASSSN